MIRIKIKNFKSIKEIDFKEKFSNIIAILGPNDSGKSNIINAISKTKNNSSFDKYDFLMEKNVQKNKKITLEINFEFIHQKLLEKIKLFLKDNEKFRDKTNEKLFNYLKNINSIQLNYSFNINVWKDKAGIINSKFENMTPNKNFAEQKKVFWNKFCEYWKKHNYMNYWSVDEKDDESVLKAYRYANNFFKNTIKSKINNNYKFIFNLIDLYINFNSITLNSPLIKEIKSQEFLRDKLDFYLNLLDDSKILNEKESSQKYKFEKWLQLLSIKPEEIKKLFDKNEISQISKIINTAKKKSNKILDRLNELINDNKKFNIKAEFLPNNIFRIYLDNNIQEGMVWLEDINKTSDGIKRFLLMFLEINSIDPYTPTILLIDEPDIHLNPYYQRKLIEILEEKSQSENIFIIYTTHSPFMVNYNESISKKIVFRNKKDNSTKLIDYCDNINKEEIGEVDLISTDMVLSDFTELNLYEIIDLSNEILLVEGSTDRIILNKALKEWKIKNLKVFIIKGWRINKTWSILSDKLNYFFKNEKVKILLDNDYAGIQIEKEIKKLWNNSGDKIKKYSDFDNNYSSGDYKLENFLDTKNKFSIAQAKEIKLSFDTNNWNNLKKWININQEK